MTTARRTAVTAFAAFATLIAAVPLAAEDKDQGGESAYIKALRDCQSKTDPVERLACYDTAVAAMVAASTEGEVKVVDREAVRETRRKLFGFSLPDLGIFGGKSDREDSDQAEDFATLQTTVAGVRALNGKLVITTAEGAQWQLDEMPARLMKPKIGQQLEIRAGALGSYFLRIDGQRGVKGRRVQ
jgi:hypothetical protein